MAEGGISGLFSRFTGGGRGNTQGGLDGTNIDKRTIERVQRFLEKLVKLCSNPQLGLKRSPPYLLDLLPHMFQTLSEIFKQYDSRIVELNSNQYFRLFIDNICNKLKRGIKLFRDSRNVYNENSTERKTLTRLSLHISHMLYELRALFPNSIFIGAEFRITKEEAAEFWKNSFGDKVIVSWKDFRMSLSNVHPITSSYEAMALKSTIDLTHNDMVSVFEFDVFTRLFQPWDTLLINWKMLAVTHTGYQAFLTYGEVKERLQKYIHKPGTYIFRLSCTRLGQWAIGYVTNEHEILQTIPQNKSLCEALILGAQEGYYLYPDGKEQNPDLTVIQHEKQKKVIQVTEEEYEIYTSMGSTFQQCKICQENDKDVKLQPCAHLLCSECLFQWQEHDKSSSLTCPFCRAQVKDYEHVEVDPFQKETNKLARVAEVVVDGAGPSRAAPPIPGAPPIPDRRTSVKQQSSSGGSPIKGQAPAPPSIPRRPGDNETLVPSRPPPLPPVNTMPKVPDPFQPPPVTSQPPPMPGQNALHIAPAPPPILTAPPGGAPSLPLSQPPPLHSTPGNDSFSSSMSATNPFFSDVQALRSQDPPGLTGNAVQLPPELPLPPIPRDTPRDDTSDDEMSSNRDLQERDEALGALGLSGGNAPLPKPKKKTKEEKKEKKEKKSSEELKKEVLQNLGLGDTENLLSPKEKKKPLRPPRSPKCKKELSEKDLKHRNEALISMGLSPKDTKLPKKVREVMTTQGTLSSLKPQPPPLPVTPIPGAGPPPIPAREVQIPQSSSTPPPLPPSAPPPTLPPNASLTGGTAPPPPPPITTLPRDPTLPPRDATLPPPLPSTLPPEDSPPPLPSTLPPGDSPPPLPSAPIPGTLPKSIEQNHVIIYETEDEIPVSSTNLNHAAFIRSDSFDGMMPEEVEFNVDISGESSSADTSRTSTMEDPNSKGNVTADKPVNQDVVPVAKEETLVSESVPGDNSGEGENGPTEGDIGRTEGDNGPTEGDNGRTEGDTGPREDGAEKRLTNYANVEYYGNRTAEYTDNIITEPADKRMTIFSEIQSEDTYNNVEEDLNNGTVSRGKFSDADLFTVAPSGWDAGQFDDSLPKVTTTENNDLYCNVEAPQQQPTPTDDVTKQLLTSPMSGGKSTSPLLNIALRPTSMYDPDQSLFEGGEHVNSVTSQGGDDIYENQPINNMSSPHNNQLPVTTKDRLLAEGFRETDIQRAVDIVGENEEMARKSCRVSLRETEMRAPQNSNVD
ncbi:E3 ubiquitin-protein ligase CBL-B-like isoform X2 [Bolinopsis microptera]|uniref:E3 ubiquitin-protein ligase CBL-B-like isoform X2 n=1 Tax=Bolinopsis microptera TaxID=2820187 RepID=UPI00307934A5